MHPRPLGRVDGFGDDEAESEGDERAEILAGFLASKRNPLEALQLPDQLLDPGAGAIERFGKESRPPPRRGFERDHRTAAALTRRCAVALAVVASVAHCRPRHDVRPEIQQDLELRAVAGLACGQVEGERQTFEIDLEMDLRREAPARAAQGLTVLPPLAPAAETWARTVVESNI